MMRRFTGNVLLLPDNGGILLQQIGSNSFVRAVAYFPDEMLLKLADPVDELPMSELVLSNDKTQIELTSLPPQVQTPA